MSGTIMRASRASGQGIDKLELVDDHPIPSVAEDHTGTPMILVKVSYAAMNPVDWKMLEYNLFVQKWPHIFGVDAAGTVASAPEGSSIKEGEVVWAFTDCGKAHSGSFAEYVRVPEDMLGRVPDGVTLEGASTLGCGALTAATGVYSHLKLSTEAGAHTGTNVLVYGASSSVGSYAVQLAKRAGCRVIAVASLRHRDWLCGALGADQLVDYRDAGWMGEVERDTANAGTRLALDAIGGDGTTSCVQLLGKLAAGQSTIVTSALKGEVAEDEVARAQCTLMAINLSTAYTDEQRPVLSGFVKLMDTMLTDGSLVPNRVKLMGGLESVPDAMREMQAGKVSGEKLVIKVG